MDTEQDAADTAVEEDAPPPADAPADDTAKWKAMARKHEAEAKRNAAAAKRLAEIEDAQKSESQRASERIAALEAEVRQRDLSLMRGRVAASFDLPAPLADRLQGDSEEEMSADAEALVAALKERYVARSVPSQRDTAAGSPGAVSPDYESMDPLELAAKSRRR